MSEVTINVPSVRFLPEIFMTGLHMFTSIKKLKLQCMDITQKKNST